MLNSCTILLHVWYVSKRTAERSEVTTHLSNHLRSWSVQYVSLYLFGCGDSYGFKQELKYLKSLKKKNYKTIPAISLITSMNSE